MVRVPPLLGRPVTDELLYRSAAGDAVTSANSVLREVTRYPEEAIPIIDQKRRIARLMPPADGMTSVEHHRARARQHIYMAAAHMLEARLLEQEEDG